MTSLPIVPGCGYSLGGSQRLPRSRRTIRAGVPLVPGYCPFSVLRDRSHSFCFFSKAVWTLTLYLQQAEKGPHQAGASSAERRRRRRRRCLLPSGNWRGKNNALSGYDGTDQPQTSRERTPNPKSCSTVSSPLPLNPLEILSYVKTLVWFRVPTVLFVSTRAQVRRGPVAYTKLIQHGHVCLCVRVHAGEINDKLLTATQAGEVTVVGGSF